MNRHLHIHLLFVSFTGAHVSPVVACGDPDQDALIPTVAASEAAGAHEWERALAAFDGTDQARCFVEPLLDVIPELWLDLDRDRRASHGPEGVEPPQNHQGAEVRYYEYPGPWIGFGDPPLVGEFASESGFPESFAFYAKYDEAGRLTRCVEFDGLWRSGVDSLVCIEMDERNEWNGVRPVLWERSWPYNGSSTSRTFDWSADGSLRSWVDRRNDRIEGSSVFEYTNGFVSGRRVFEGGQQRVQYTVERDLAHRITQVRREAVGPYRARSERKRGSIQFFKSGGRETFFRYPADGGLQRITQEANGDVKGRHWLRGADGVEVYCSFRFYLFDGQPMLEGSRTRYIDGLKHIESFVVPVETIPNTKQPIDPALLLDATVHSHGIRPQGQFWPARQDELGPGIENCFVIERDERGNWLKTGYIDPKTGKTEVQYARTVEYL